MQYFKITDHGGGGCAFLESGWSVKDLGITTFIFTVVKSGPRHRVARHDLPVPAS